MVEVKNFFEEEVERNKGIRNFKLWRTEHATFWVRTPHKEYGLKPYDMVVLTARQPYQLCNTGEGRLLLLVAGNSGVDGKPRTRVPEIASHLPVSEPIVV